MPKRRKIPNVVFGLLAFLIVYIGGTFGLQSLNNHEKAADQLDWGNPTTCAIPASEGGNTYYSRARGGDVRTMVVICAGVRHHITMTVSDSDRTTTRLWHNNRTNQNYIACDTANLNFPDERCDGPHLGIMDVDFLYFVIFMAGALIGLGVWIGVSAKRYTSPPNDDDPVYHY